MSLRNPERINSTERRLSICETRFLNANSFFYNRDNRASATTKQILNQNQFGGVLGGPVIKNKLFAFFSYQGTRQKNGIGAQGVTTALLPAIPAIKKSPTSIT